MECVEYSKDSPIRKVYGKILVKYDVSNKQVSIEIKDRFDKNNFKEWTLIQSGFNGNRITVYSTRKIDEKKLNSPVLVSDIDFSKPRIKFQTFGGYIDFDEIISTDSEYECKRTN
jgi:hypothetical protein